MQYEEKQNKLGDTTYRHALWKKFTEMDMPLSTRLEKVQGMGKLSNEEKEKMAKRLLEEIEKSG